MGMKLRNGTVVGLRRCVGVMHLKCHVKCKAVSMHCYDEKLCALSGWTVVKGQHEFCYAHARDQGHLYPCNQYY